MANSASPESFSLHLLAGEGLVCGVSKTTPLAPYLVTCTPEDMTPAVLQAWFIQSIEPLVGGVAAESLKRLMEANQSLTTDFLREALNFRRSLK